MKQGNKKPRCGSRIYNGHEIPHNAEVKIYKGRECYLSGIEEQTNIIKFLDTGEILKVRISSIFDYNKTA